MEIGFVCVSNLFGKENDEFWNIIYYFNWTDYVSIVLTGYDKLLFCSELHSNPGKDFEKELFAHKEVGKKFS